jgi:Phospholipase_D-nuclease N-terminal
VLFEIEGVLGFLLLALWIWALVDCITSDSAIIRNLPKGVWLIIVIILFDIGAILWLLLGRPLNKHWRPALEGESRYAPPRRPALEDRVDLGPEVSDRRSAELDRRLDAWERERAVEAVGATGATDDDLATRARELDAREAALRKRELEMRSRELDAREQSLDDE